MNMLTTSVTTSGSSSCLSSISTLPQVNQFSRNWTDHLPLIESNYFYIWFKFNLNYLDCQSSFTFDAATITAGLNENNLYSYTTPSVMHNFYQNSNIYNNNPINNYQNLHYYNNLAYSTQCLQPNAVAAAMQQYGEFFNSTSSVLPEFDVTNNKLLNGTIHSQVNESNCINTTSESFTQQNNCDLRQSELIFPSTSTASLSTINAPIKKIIDDSNFFNSNSVVLSNNSIKLANKTVENPSSFLLSNFNQIKGKKTKDKTVKNINL